MFKRIIEFFRQYLQDADNKLFVFMLGCTLSALIILCAISLQSCRGVWSIDNETQVGDKLVKTSIGYSEYLTFTDFDYEPCEGSEILYFEGV